MAAKKQSIESVKEAHEMTLMGVPGVEGVGIGMDEAGPYVRVYASKLSKVARARIPVDLEGFRVKVESSGPFEAQ